MWLTMLGCFIAQGSALVMIAHPHCSCTRASISELARLMARIDVDARVLFSMPDQTDLWASADRIPGVSVGLAEGHFGAHTSGTVLLYSAEGDLQFAGGLTATRGHEGGSIGRDRILALVSGRPVEQDVSAIFGCSVTRRSGSPRA